MPQSQLIADVLYETKMNDGVTQIRKCAKTTENWHNKQFKQINWKTGINSKSNSHSNINGHDNDSFK